MKKNTEIDFGVNIPEIEFVDEGIDASHVLLLMIICVLAVVIFTIGATI